MALYNYSITITITSTIILHLQWVWDLRFLYRYRTNSCRLGPVKWWVIKTCMIFCDPRFFANTARIVVVAMALSKMTPQKQRTMCVFLHDCSKYNVLSRYWQCHQLLVVNTLINQNDTLNSSIIMRKWISGELVTSRELRALSDTSFHDTISLFGTKGLVQPY